MIDRRRLVLGSASTLLLSLAPWQIARGARMVDVRMWPAEEYTRVTLEYDSPLNFKYFFVRSSKPLRLVVDIKGLELTVALQKQIAAVKPDDPYIAAMRIGQFQPDTVRLVMDLKTDVKPEVFQLQPFANYKYRLVFDIYPAHPTDEISRLLNGLEEGSEAPDGDPLGSLLAGLDKGAAGQALIGIDRLANLYVVFWITVVTVVLLFMFARSRYGRAVKAIRDDEIAASASGINITYMKVLVFAISAFFAGIAGGIFAQYIGSLNPAMAGWLQSINYVIMVVFGGMGSLTGSIVSAIALTILPELLRAFSTYRMLVYSVALVLIMIFRPQGIFGNWEFSLTKTINKLFYPMKVKAHGKSKQAESTAKAVKDTAKTDETVETAADTKEAQA